MSSTRNIDATIRFSVVPESVADHEVSGLSANAVRLYAILDRYGNSEGAVACPSRATLAKRCGISVDTVDRVKRELVDAGLLEVVNRRHEKGDPDTNEYRLHREGVAAELRPPSRTGAARGSRTGAAQQKEPSTEGSVSTDVETAASGRDFVGFFVDECRRVTGADPLDTAKARLGRDAGKLAKQGVTPDTIRESITELVEAGLGVGSFLGVADQMHRGGYRGRSAARTGLSARDLATRARELEEAGL